MSMLPLTFSIPVTRVLRCPRLLEIPSEQFNVELQTITDAFYDMIELSIVNPTEFPPFNWFIMAEDEANPEMIWFLSDTNIQLAIKLDEDPNNPQPLSDRQPSNVTQSDMDLITTLTSNINDALRKRFNDDTLVPILEEIPTKNNNYLFKRPGVLLGHFKFEEDEEYKPFIMEQIDEDNYSLYLSDEEFLFAYCERAIRGEFGLEYDELELEFHESLANEINTQGEINGKYRWEGWTDWEDFIILHDPQDTRDYELIIPVDGIISYIKSTLSDYLEVSVDEITLNERPSESNNYFVVDDSDTMAVKCRYNNQLYTALINTIEDSHGEVTTKVKILDEVNDLL